MQLIINHCILTAVTPLSKDNLIYGQLSWEPKQSLQREVTVVIPVSTKWLEFVSMNQLIPFWMSCINACMSSNKAWKMSMNREMQGEHVA